MPLMIFFFRSWRMKVNYPYCFKQFKHNAFFLSPACLPRQTNTDNGSGTLFSAGVSQDLPHVVHRRILISKQPILLKWPRNYTREIFLGEHERYVIDCFLLLQTLILRLLPGSLGSRCCISSSVFGHWLCTWEALHLVYISSQPYSNTSALVIVFTAELQYFIHPLPSRNIEERPHY